MMRKHIEAESSGREARRARVCLHQFLIWLGDSFLNFHQKIQRTYHHRIDLRNKIIYLYASALSVGDRPS